MVQLLPDFTWENKWMSTREAILAALYDRLLSAQSVVLRGEVLPERILPTGLLVLRDGDPGSPDITLSPLEYHYQHRAEIEVIAQGCERNVVFDQLCISVSDALAIDRTLNGYCDWVEALAPEPVDLAVEGGAALKAAQIPVILYYSSEDPLK
jgi:hypothetical protein